MATPEANLFPQLQPLPPHVEFLIDKALDGKPLTPKQLEDLKANAPEFFSPFDEQEQTYAS